MGGAGGDVKKFLLGARGETPGSTTTGGGENDWELDVIVKFSVVVSVSFLAMSSVFRSRMGGVG